MEASSLELLVAIIDAGSLSNAARRLRMSRANVSHRLNEFEKRLGQQLLRRTTRRIEPTAVGLRLYEHGCAIRDELIAARDSVSMLSQELAGRVRVSVPTGFGQLVMARWLVDFKRTYPEIHLNVVFENRVEDLMRGEVDFAVRVTRDLPQNFVVRTLGNVSYAICASAEYAATRPMPKTPLELQGVPIIAASVYVNQYYLTVSDNGGNAQEVVLEPTISSENTVFLRECILSDLGIGIVPEYVVSDELKTGAVVKTLEQWQITSLGAHVYLIYMPNRRRTRAESTFIDFLLQKAQEPE